MVKIAPANAGDTGDAGSIPGSERFPGGEHGNSLLFSCLENSMDRGAWGCYARCPNPQAGREKASKTMQLAKRGSLLLTQARALCHIQRSGAGQGAPSSSCYTNL